jgi:hypothetical protein
VDERSSGVKTRRNRSGKKKNYKRGRDIAIQKCINYLMLNLVNAGLYRCIISENVSKGINLNFTENTK